MDFHFNPQRHFVSVFFAVRIFFMGKWCVNWISWAHKVVHLLQPFPYGQLCIMDSFCGMNYVHTTRNGVNWLVTQLNYLSNKLRELVIKLILLNTALFQGFFQKKFWTELKSKPKTAHIHLYWRVGHILYGTWRKRIMINFSLCKPWKHMGKWMYSSKPHMPSWCAVWWLYILFHSSCGIL